MELPKYELSAESSLTVFEFVSVGLRGKIPVIRIDENLGKYRSAPLFQDKVDKANDILKRVGLPKAKNA